MTGNGGQVIPFPGPRGAANPEAAHGAPANAPRLGANIVAADVDGDRLAENIVQFARLLRASGLSTGPQQTVLATQAVQAAGIENPKILYWTLHSVFVRRRAERDLFNQAFVMFWRDPDYIGKMMSLVVPQLPRDQGAPEKPISRRLSEAMRSGHDITPAREIDEVDVTAEGSWSGREVLQTRDFAQMSAAELAQARREIAALRLTFEETRSRRQAPVRRGGQLDLRRVLRTSAARGHDFLLPHQRAPQRQRLPIVILCDVSGSMEQYARIFLHFIYAVANDRDEVHTFLFGTRLTNITKLLRDRDPDRAISKVSADVQDWSGGTRIGACLETFNRQWARRVLGRNAMVLLITDGLDREDAGSMELQVRRLAANAHRLLWLNPLMRYGAYEPLAAGAAVLDTHVDEMRGCHNLQSLAEIAKVLGR